ncbi:HAMP domain-containing histidine kinase [Novosphingobium flavum]|uniref:histidine kinase n=1 Tax=Novosphingobium flavum TaxID=1778672 RepID=A0A7X1FQ76_9SPHN|nr:HAMP domain-containing histidine kinase [Novosphingobium flavum]MBC2664945.1 HAMP domain-containing histidine kinase [Novosphingobium flavum]
MHVDDRLATVLDLRTDGDLSRRIQFRQLVDLIGTSPAGARSDRIDAAFVRLSELAGLIPAVDRARAIGESGVRLRNPRLVAELAACEPAVALAAIRAARLGEHDWIDLIPALPLAARGLLRSRRDLGAKVDTRLDQLGITDRALPTGDPAADIAPEANPAPTVAEPTSAEPTSAEPAVAAIAPEAPAEAEPVAAPPSPLAFPAAPAEPVQGIAAIVRRIEAFRRNREAGVRPVAANDSPRLPLGEQEPSPSRLAAFSFATDSAGRIGWAEAPVSGMAVGILLAGEDSAAGNDLAETFRRRQPLRAVQIELEGAPAIAGTWRMDASPDFDAAGHFIGYVGRFRRPAPPPPPPRHGEADRIRQVLHELRTPVNAIQGFAEVIQQQLFGATPHEYRALAAGIAADAARMLAGFEELDRYARLDSGALAPEAGATDLAMSLAAIIHQLEAFTTARSSGFTLEAAPGLPPVGIAADEAARLGWRLLATLAGNARPGEVLPLMLSAVPEGGALRLAARLPDALAGLADLFEAAPPQAGQALSAGMFGNGFTLRLAAAEARAAGGSMEREGNELVLILPVGANEMANVCLQTFDKQGSAEAG